MSSSDEKNSSKSVLHGKYELGRLLGHGTFAKVYYARNLQTNKSVAIKVVAKDKVLRAGMMEQIKREISVMKMMRNHPSIVSLVEVMATKTKIFIAMEYVRGGELFAKISKGKLSETLARHYFKQLMTAVDFCHSRGVYHRDLKPENLLLDECGNLKVTDFGLSAFSDHLRQDGLLHTTCGTPAYVAPEVIVKKGYDGAKADIWSCGVILFVLLAGYLPFQDDNVVNLYKKIYRGDFKCPPWFSSESRRLIIRMLDPNPNTRINVESIMQSSWFNKPLPRSLSSNAVDSYDCSSHNDVVVKEKGRKETETLNAFHIISMSEGLDLSRLFDDEKDRGMRFATTRDLSSVISKLEELAKVKNLSVKKKSDSWVRLQGQECGRKGRLGIDADLFELAPSLVVVEVRRSSGCTSEYNRFCSSELGPALMDVARCSSPPSSMA